MLSSVIPSVNAKWVVKEVPSPQAGTNQVLKIHASGVCYTDVHITKAGLGVKFPYTIGHESAGEIVALADGVTTRKVGDRVGVLG
jgi:alcohol dehydrogenase